MTVRRIYGEFVGGRAALGLLILRAVFGAALMMHGWSKIQAPFGWMKGPHAAPPIFQALAALAEFGGGAAFIVGLLTPLAAIGVLCNMAVAYYLSHQGDPWIGKGKTFESASLYFTVALALLFSGPGLYSLDAFLFGSRRGR
jgi:putative oxidoreductase